jgi:myosin heavy subunit
VDTVINPFEEDLNECDWVEIEKTTWKAKADPGHPFPPIREGIYKITRVLTKDMKKEINDLNNKIKNINDAKRTDEELKKEINEKLKKYITDKEKKKLQETQEAYNTIVKDKEEKIRELRKKVEKLKKWQKTKEDYEALKKGE